METIIKVVIPNEEKRSIARSGDDKPGYEAEVRGRDITRRSSLAVEVVVVPGVGDPAPVLRTETKNPAVTRPSWDEGALDDEDILTQAEEANALDPVG